MDRKHSEYRGWTVCVTTTERRKSLGHATRRDPPHQVLMAEGWGEKLVLADLRRQVDAFEDGSRCGPSGSAGIAGA